MGTDQEPQLHASHSEVRKGFATQGHRQRVLRI